MNATEQYDTLPYGPNEQHPHSTAGASNPAYVANSAGATDPAGTTTHTADPSSPVGASAQSGTNGPIPPEYAAQPGGEAPRPKRGHGWVGIITTIVGSIVLVGIFGWTLASGVWHGAIKPVDAETSVAATESLRIDVGYGDLDVNFSDAVTEATLEVTGFSRGGEPSMTLTNTDGEVVLETREDNSLLTGGPGWWYDNDLQGVLTLPAELEGKLDVQLSLGVGEIVLNGDLHDIRAEVGAGSLHVNSAFNIGEFSAGIGSIELNEGGNVANIEAGTGDVVAIGNYNSFTADVGIGHLTFDGTVKDKADFTFDMGGGDIVFVESMPLETRIETNMGDVQIDMPRVPIQLDGPFSVMAMAEDAGYEINGGADAPRVLILVDMGDVSFY